MIDEIMKSIKYNSHDLGEFGKVIKLQYIEPILRRYILKTEAPKMADSDMKIEVNVKRDEQKYWPCEHIYFKEGTWWNYPKKPYYGQELRPEEIFCSSCGAKRPSPPTDWLVECIKEGYILGNNMDQEVRMIAQRIRAHIASWYKPINSQIFGNLEFEKGLKRGAELRDDSWLKFLGIQRKDGAE